MTNEELKATLNEMDIPEFRLDVSAKGNVRWLMRNLAVRNRFHPNFKITIMKLKSLS